jgi:rhodanese-related sulfurtransferase
MEASVDEAEDTPLAPLECDRSGATEMIEAGARLIDVRTAHEFEAGRIPGSERIGLEELSERRSELSAGVPVVFYCRIGNRSLMAAEAFADAGFDAVSLNGGIEAWVEDGGAIDGFVSEPGEAASILEARARNSES